ncbi:MAG TPA: hypothetical protein PLU80_16645, partial [Acidobacteriota bacterium]|nr:hypothetical protein [Acidobacteriota bacterium]
RETASFGVAYGLHIELSECLFTFGSPFPFSGVENLLKSGLLVSFRKKFTVAPDARVPPLGLNHWQLYFF